MIAVNHWKEIYEKADNRRCKQMKWVAIPTSHDGNGYGRVAAHKNAVELFCAFVLIVETAAKCPERGKLTDKDGRALTPEDIAYKTRFPKRIFELAFKVLTEPKIGWLVVLPDKLVVLPEASG